MKALPILLCLVLALAPPVEAGSAEAPEMTDPAGDAGPMAATGLPAGMEDVDILAAWFEGETEDTIDLAILLAGPSRGRPNTVWAQIVDVADKRYAIGFMEFGGDRGAFLCDYVSGTTVENCIDIEGSMEGPQIRATVPRENITSPIAGDTVTISEGITITFAFVPVDTPLPLGAAVPWDLSAAGAPYILLLGGVEAENETAPAPEVLASAAGGRANANASGDASSPATNETPVPGLLAVAALSLVALRRRR